MEAKLNNTWHVKETQNEHGFQTWVLSSSDTIVTLICKANCIDTKIETDEGTEEDSIPKQVIGAYLFGIDHRLVYKDIVTALEDQ